MSLPELKLLPSLRLQEPGLISIETGDITYHNSKYRALCVELLSSDEGDIILCSLRSLSFSYKLLNIIVKLKKHIELYLKFNNLAIINAFNQISTF